MEPDEAETIAQAFHEAYERLAPDYGYETREATAVPWNDVPDNNRWLMTAVARDLIDRAVITPLGEHPPEHPDDTVIPTRPSVGERVRDLVTMALTTDGERHKQWYLEQIADLVLSPFEREHFEAEYDYEPGIAP